MSQLLYTQLFTDTSLQGYWLYENNLTDGSSHGRTLVGGGNVFAPGQFGTAFKPNNQSAEQSYAPALNSPFSLVGWAQINTQPANNACISLFGVENSSQEILVGTDYFNNGGTYEFTLNTRAGTIQTQSFVLTQNSQWHHYAITFDGTTLILFIDGVPKISFAPNLSGNGGATTGFYVRWSTPFHSQDSSITTLYNDVGLFSRQLLAWEVSELASIGAALFFQQF